MQSLFRISRLALVIGICVGVLSATGLCQETKKQEVDKDPKTEVDKATSQTISDIERLLLEGSLGTAAQKARELSRFRDDPSANFATKMAISTILYSVELAVAAEASLGDQSVSKRALVPLIRVQQDLVQLIDAEIASKQLTEIRRLRLEATKMRSYDQMASVYVATKHFDKAFASIDEMEKIFEATKAMHGKKHVMSVFSNGQTVKHTVTQLEMAKMLTRRDIIQRRIDYGKHASAVDKEKYQAGLVSSLRAFSEELPADVFAYARSRERMGLEGSLDLDELSRLLDSCSDKKSPQYIGSVLSFGNLLRAANRLDDALERYNEALASGVPSSRRAELQVALAATHEALGNFERAKQHYLNAETLRGDRFATVPLAIRRIDEKLKEKQEQEEEGQK